MNEYQFWAIFAIAFGLLFAGGLEFHVRVFHVEFRLTINSLFKAFTDERKSK